MGNRIQARADHYADAVVESLKTTMQEQGEAGTVARPISVSQLAEASVRLHTDLCDWFPLRSAVK